MPELSQINYVDQFNGTFYKDVIVSWL